MNTHKFTGDMSDQIDKDREELIALRSQVEQLTRERNEAVKEASRRDEKWMSGINEIIGSKLDYQDPCARNNASRALGDLVRERDEARAACAVMREGLEHIACYPVQSEPMGGALDMQDIASNALAKIKGGAK